MVIEHILPVYLVSSVLFKVFNIQFTIAGIKDCFFLLPSSIALYEYTIIHFFHSTDAYLDYSQF